MILTSAKNLILSLCGCVVVLLRLCTAWYATVFLFSQLYNSLLFQSSTSTVTADSNGNRFLQYAARPIDHRSQSPIDRSIIAAAGHRSPIPADSWPWLLDMLAFYSPRPELVAVALVCCANLVLSAQTVLDAAAKLAKILCNLTVCLVQLIQKITATFLKNNSQWSVNTSSANRTTVFDHQNQEDNSELTTTPQSTTSPQCQQRLFEHHDTKKALCRADKDSCVPIRRIFSEKNLNNNGGHLLHRVRKTSMMPEINFILNDLNKPTSSTLDHHNNMDDAKNSCSLLKQRLGITAAGAVGSTRNRCQSENVYCVFNYDNNFNEDQNYCKSTMSYNNGGLISRNFSSVELTKLMAEKKKNEG